MKAKIYQTVQCPKCTSCLYNHEEYMTCENENCELYGKKFERKTIELVEIHHQKPVPPKSRKKGEGQQPKIDNFADNWFSMYAD